VTASIRDLLRARPADGTFSLGGVDPKAPRAIGRARAERETERDRELLGRWQERLFAEGKRSLLIVLQGKDGTIKHVIGAMNPQGVRVVSFKRPTETERSHPFLWRIKKGLPESRYVGAFNRSHYEDVVAARVDGLVSEEEWRGRYATINRFERSLVARGVTVVKLFLHISFEEQRKRLLKRLDDPSKHWKFDPHDLDEREHWDAYMEAYSDAIARCSTSVAPWYVVPSDSKWFRNWAVGRVLVETFEEMRPRYPQPVLDVPALRRRLRKREQEPVSPRRIS
jgi:PPK2 family polyphosphate:nucleotide phosphotransferase